MFPTAAFLVGLLIFFFGITWDILLYQGFLPFIELTFYKYYFRLY